MTRLATKGARTRHRLLVAAGRELVRAGGDLELSLVARRAGVSAGAPYRHFESKAALLSALVDDFFDRFDAAIFKPTFVDGGDWFARESLRTRRFVEFFYAEPTAVVILTALAGTSEVAVRHRSRIERSSRAAAANIARGQAAGEITQSVDAEIAGAAIVGAMFHGVAAALGSRPRPPRERVAGELVRFVVAALSSTSLRTPRR